MQILQIHKKSDSNEIHSLFGEVFFRNITSIFSKLLDSRLMLGRHHQCIYSNQTPSSELSWIFGHYFIIKC